MPVSYRLPILKTSALLLFKQKDQLMSFAKRLYLLLFIAILGLTGLTVFGNAEIDKVYASTNFIYMNVVESMKLVDNMRSNFLHTRIELRSYALNRDAGKSRKIEDILQSYRSGMSNTIWLYLSPDGCQEIACVYDARDEANTKNISRLWNEYNTKIDAVIEMAGKGEAGKTRANAMLEEQFELGEQVSDAISESFDYNVLLVKKLTAEAATLKNNAVKLSYLIAALTILLVGASGLLIIRYVMRSLGGEPVLAAQIARRMALGDLSSEIDVDSADRTSMMAGIKTLLSALNRISRHADAVAAGNLDKEVETLSAHDKLGKAINNMMISLRTSRIVDENRNWLNEGHNQLTNALTGDYTQHQVADIAISTLSHYIGAARGVIFALNPDNSKLDLIGSFMHSDSARSVTSFRIGEGAIGQVAHDKKPILLSGVSDNAQQIVTGTTTSVAQFSYTYPLLHENHLMGVIEISSLERLSESRQDMLLNATEVIASFLYIAEQRGKIDNLLAISEQAERDTRKQNEQLQNINSLMEEQQQQLQQQSEELQQSNQQMEEQQQILQQQSEELRQANAQMAEQQKLLEINNDELRQSQARIDEKASQLEQSNHYKSEFLANMSHELRTPLNAIILLSKMMADNRDQRLVEADIKKAEVIHRSGNDLLHLINDVLDLSKVDAGRMDLNFEKIPTKGLIGNLQDLFSSVAQNNGLEFRTDDQVQGMIISDPDKLGQILRNLLSNAFKFTKSGSVTLSIEKKADEQYPVWITVRDTGIGIPEEKLGTIFEAFRQVDGPISREYGGTGLGLTISLRFAELLGGTIHIRSTVGQGSEFSVCLPDHPPVATEIAEANPKPAITPPKKLPVTASLTAPPVMDDRNRIISGDKIILLIDDDVEFCRAVVDINRKLHYKTVVAHSAKDSLILARQHKPEGILLDLGLPDMDGADLLHEIKSSPDLAMIPVYVISARDRDQMKVGHSIVGYIQKPADQDQIAEAEALLLSTFGSQSQAGILIVSIPEEINSDLLALIQERFSGEHRPVQHAVNGPALLSVLEQQPWGAVIVNMTGLTVADALAIARLSRGVNAGTSLLFYGADNLNDDEEAMLRGYTDSIIATAGSSEQRLLENTERLLRKIHQDHTLTSEATPKDRRLTSKRVLVIDDDIRNLFVLTAALEQEGARVINASNGRRAMELLEFEPVDLIITDIMMPEMDGYQTIAAVRANPKLAALPIIALSAKAMPEDRKNILDTGADDYLSKPVDYDVLSNMVALWCSKKH